jgi:hypothetical protein
MRDETAEWLRRWGMCVEEWESGVDIYKEFSF